MKYHNSGLLEALKKQIEKIELLIENFSMIKNFKIYKNNPLANLFNTNSENFHDFTKELNSDYQEILNTTNDEINKYNIQKLGEKIEALFKYIKYLKAKLQKKQKNSIKKDNSNQNTQSKNQLYRQSLEHRKTWLLGMLKKINNAIDKKAKEQNQSEQVIKLKAKKLEIEKELFSITEQL